MTKRVTRICLGWLLASVVLPSLGVGTAAATVPSPAWRIETLSLPSHFVPEDEAHDYGYEVRALDATGGVLGSGLVTLRDSLAKGLTVKSAALTIVTPENTVGGFPLSIKPSNEIQSVKVEATGGTFTLSFAGEESAPVPFDATAAEVQQALAALPSIGPSDVVVAGGPGDSAGTSPYLVTFTRSLGLRDVATLGANPLGLTGAAHQVTVTTTQPGGGICEVESSEGAEVVVCRIPPKVEGLNIAREALRLKVLVRTPATLEGQPLLNRAAVEGGGGTAAEAIEHNAVSSEPAFSGLSRFETEMIAADGTPDNQAGSHPYAFITSFELNTELSSEGRPIPARGDLRNVNVTLPPGLIGDPTATTTCDPQDFSEVSNESNLAFNGCPAGSVVGSIDSLAETTRVDSPVFNLTPPPGMPALLGFQVAGFSFFIKTSIGPGPEHPIEAELSNLSEIERPIGGRLIIWGTPGDPAHDRFRGTRCLSVLGISVGSCSGGLAPRPFLRLPTSCESTLPTQMQFDTWPSPGTLVGGISTLPVPQNCSQLAFSPTLSVRPQTSVADSPSGISVDLHIPQNDDPELLASADLRDLAIELPEGLTVNPASASGLQACSTSQISLESTAPPACPDASKLGTVEVGTPLLDHPANGAVYLAAQKNNPFGSLLAIYVVVNDPQSGVVLKLGGKISPDSATGRLTTSFTNNPQIPFEDLHVRFFDGPHAALRTPLHCGVYMTHSDLRPWSAPESGPDATPGDSFEINAGPQGACPTGALEPTLSAGVAAPIAGAFTPFTARLARPDGSGEIDALSLSPPAGLLAKLKGIPYCSEEAIAHAAARTQPGEGALEEAQPSCPADSQVGTAQAGVGAGPDPLYVAGRLYLAGPYREAPLSLVTIIPAIAGPFDLGVVVDRVQLQVDTQTARVTAASDPFPTILSGIPVDLRDLRISLNRPQFTVAPTSCAQKSVDARVSDSSGRSATAADRFQVGACKALGFKPQLSFRLRGGIRRASHPALTATVKMRPGDANIARTQVILPEALFIDPTHLSTSCTRPQFAAHACPKGTILGTARAYSPLLSKPLKGKVYFRSNGAERELPDLVADLSGQIHIVLVGFIDSIGKKGTDNRRVRTTFATVPDAPVSKFVLSLNGGKRGLLELSRNLCAASRRATVLMRAQNGRQRNFRSRLSGRCKSYR